MHGPNLNLTDLHQVENVNLNPQLPGHVWDGGQFVSGFVTPTLEHHTNITQLVVVGSCFLPSPEIIISADHDIGPVQKGGKTVSHKMVFPFPVSNAWA